MLTFCLLPPMHWASLYKLLLGPKDQFLFFLFYCFSSSQAAIFVVLSQVFNDWCYHNDAAPHKASCWTACPCRCGSMNSNLTFCGIEDWNPSIYKPRDFFFLLTCRAWHSAHSKSSCCRPSSEVTRRHLQKIAFLPGLAFSCALIKGDGFGFLSPLGSAGARVFP